MSNSTNASDVAETGRRIALVIGVNHAPNSQLPPLNYAAADAVAMAEVLQQHCNFELLEPPLLNEQATSDRVKDAVRSLARNRNADDFLLLYFSGHGQPMFIEAERRDIYLTTSNFKEHDVEEDEAAHCSMRWLRDKLYLPTKAGRVLLILDCCYAGDIDRTASDPYLEELLQRINYYFGRPGSASEARQGGLRLALTATGHNTKALEKDGHGLMTGLLLPALRGDEADAFDKDGLVSVELLYHYLQNQMLPEQKPSLTGDTAGRSCILASYPERAAEIRSKSSRLVVNERPNDYIPFPHNPLFQPRPGEFEQLEAMLFDVGTRKKPLRLGLVGVIGMGGIGKTQLAIEFAYRSQKQQRFPAGIFWMPATGEISDEWQRPFAELAFKTDYLPPKDEVSHPEDEKARQENEARRARYFCRYLAQHPDALLILDNVENPDLVISAPAKLAGSDIACSILYTSRIITRPPEVTTYAVEALPEKEALRLLLATARPRLITEIEAGSKGAEAQAARNICRDVGYLPLVLVHLRRLLARDQLVTLVRLAEVLKQRGALELAKTQQGDAAPLFTTFRLSWDKIRDESARSVFKLACYFPEAAPIPRWLLGLASGLGEEHGDSFEPLGEACLHLQELSLFEELSGDQVRLHPLVREFGRRLVDEDDEKGRALREEAGKRLANACRDLSWLEQRARREGYRECLEQVREMRYYVEWLGATSQAEQIGRVERLLDHESYLLADRRWWPTRLPGLFYQQLANRAVEAGQPLPPADAPGCWLRQTKPVGAEDQALLRRFVGHTNPVSSVAFSPDGKLVLTGSRDQTARLWEMGSGQELGRLEGHTGPVYSVAFSPDGKLILTGSGDQTVRLWNVNSGQELGRLEGHTGSVYSVAFSPDGKLILTGSRDQTVRLWNVSSGQELRKLEGHTKPVYSVAFSPDGKLILTGSHDQTARLWNVNSGRELGRLEGHTGPVNSVAFSPDGKLALTGSHDQTARLWEMGSGRELGRLEGHMDWVYSVAFSPDGKLALTGSGDRTARLWNVNSGQELGRLEGHMGPVYRAVYSPDGKLVLTGSHDQTARLWEMGSGRELGRLEGHTGPVNSVAFSPDGKLVLTGSGDQTARLWEMGSGRELGRLEGHTGPVNSVAFSPDGKLVLTGSGDHTARLWEVSSGRELGRLEGPDWVNSVAFSPDGKLALTGSGDHIARLWKVNSGRELGQLEGHSRPVNSVVFSPDGKLVLTGSGDHTARLWEMGSGRELGRLEGHTGPVNSVAFSPDGKLVLTGSGDHTARLWKVSSERELGRLEGHTSPVNSAVFSSDGRLAITCDTQGQVRFWHVQVREPAHLLGIYVAAYEVGALHWQDATQVVLVDTGGPGGYPHFYYLTLEGM